MVKLGWNLDTKIMRIRLGWMAFITVKDVHKTKPDMTLRANLFNDTILTAMLCANESSDTTKKEEQSYGKVPARNTIARALPKRSNSEVERSEGYYHEILKAEIPLGRISLKLRKNRCIRAVEEWDLRNRKQLQRWDEIVKRFKSILRKIARTKWKCTEASNVENIKQSS